MVMEKNTKKYKMAVTVRVDDYIARRQYFERA